MKHTNQSLIDQNARLQTELANNEVQRSALESQLRLSTTWLPESSETKDEELLRQLRTAQRERSEMRGKLDALNNKVKQLSSISVIALKSRTQPTGRLIEMKFSALKNSHACLWAGEAARIRQTKPGATDQRGEGRRYPKQELRTPGKGSY